MFSPICRDFSALKLHFFCSVHCRYFSKFELKELFTLDDPHSSTTQQQLETMHSGQRLTDSSLDEHIAYLYSLGRLTNVYVHPSVLTR